MISRLRSCAAVLAGLAAAATGPGFARAGLLEVQQIAKGMECAECAHNLKIEVRKLDGVEAASASWNRRVLTVRFARGAKTTLADVRAVLRRQHFEPGEAEIVVAGRLVRAGGGRSGVVLDGGPGARYGLDLEGLPAASLAHAGRLEGGEQEVVITGRLAGENPDSVLHVLDIRLKGAEGAVDSSGKIERGTP